jgi:SAM-dependent methyltransferase
MAKQGEIDYLRQIGREGIEHAMNKPFSDHHCASNLMQLGALMALLPPPPARLLDLGCGVGWTSVFFARRGYDVVGVDISPDMILHANLAKGKYQVTNVEFVVADYEAMPFANAFDCAVFYDSLHHAIDEFEAVRMVHRALRPGGVCLTSEPGAGHAMNPSVAAIARQYNVTEKSMPPRHIRRIGKLVGFHAFQTFPHAQDLKQSIYATDTDSRAHRLAARLGPLRRMALKGYALFVLFLATRRPAIVKMVK